MSYADTLDRILAGDFDDATEEQRARAVRELITVCSAATAAAALQPVPFLDLAVSGPVQIAMVQGIGRIHGYELNRQSVLEILSTFGASILAKQAVIGGMRFVPVFGSLVGVGMAWAMTWAIGEVADHYFACGRGVPPHELRSMLKRVYKEKRAEARRNGGPPTEPQAPTGDCDSHPSM